MTQRQLKRVCFTLNNYTEDDERRIQENSDLYEYAIYGREVAPTTGTRHLQGFINFKTKRDFNIVKRIIGELGHIEPAKGTDQQNKVYCGKGGDFQKIGICKGQGHRKDLEDLVDDIKGGLELYALAEKHTGLFVRYHRGIERTRDIIRSGPDGNNRRNFKTEVCNFGVLGEWCFVINYGSGNVLRFGKGPAHAGPMFIHVLMVLTLYTMGGE